METWNFQMNPNCVSLTITKPWSLLMLLLWSDEEMIINWFSPLPFKSAIISRSLKRRRRRLFQWCKQTNYDWLPFLHVLICATWCSIIPTKNSLPPLTFYFRSFSHFGFIHWSDFIFRVSYRHVRRPITRKRVCNFMFFVFFSAFFFHQWKCF